MKLRTLLLALAALLLLSFLPHPARAERAAFDDIGIACAYVRQQGELRAEKIALTLSPAAQAGRSEDELCDLVFDALSVCSDVALYTLRGRDGSLRLTLKELKYRDGVRMLDAHESGDASLLSDEERRCLAYAEALAADICREADDPLQRELMIHDYLCDHIAYADDEGDGYWRLLTACSGLLDGRGNCQAYADAFYLLGRLAGLDVDFVAGLCEGEGHLWNSLRLNGCLVMVDVTYDDLELGLEGVSDASHLYFNCAADLLTGEDRTWSELTLSAPLMLWTPATLAYFRPAQGEGVLASNLDGFFRACEASYDAGARGAEGLLWNCVADPDEVGDAYAEADLGTDPDAWYLSEETRDYTWVLVYWGE